MPILARETTIYPAGLLDGLLDHGAAGSSDRRWWAVYTRARQEKALAREILRYEIPFYLPLIAKENFIRSRRVHSFIPLFSGYVFLFGTEAERVRTLTTSRVSRMLPVVDQERLHGDLKNIQTLIAAGAPLTVESRLEPGRRVRIKRGIMRGVEGSVVTRRGKCRVIVAVDFLQQGVSVEIDDFMLEPIDWSKPKGGGDFLVSA